MFWNKALVDRIFSFLSTGILLACGMSFTSFMTMVNFVVKEGSVAEHCCVRVLLLYKDTELLIFSVFFTNDLVSTDLSCSLLE